MTKKNKSYELSEDGNKYFKKLGILILGYMMTIIKENKMDITEEHIKEIFESFEFTI